MNFIVYEWVSCWSAALLCILYAAKVLALGPRRIIDQQLDAPWGTSCVKECGNESNDPKLQPEVIPVHIVNIIIMICSM